LATMIFFVGERQKEKRERERESQFGLCLRMTKSASQTRLSLTFYRPLGDRGRKRNET
jgi:hypothetical protein